METRALGSLKVSVVGLGCNNFGTRIGEEQTAAVVNAALDAGITLFDTADSYGRTESEWYLGKALGRHRDEVVIATKFASPIDDDETHRGASARWVKEAVDGSLRRLGTDHIDLYQQHFPDAAVPIEETLGALDDLVRAGKVREIGNSNFSGAQIDEAAEIAAEHGWAAFVSAQNYLNLLERGPLTDVVPACQRHGLGQLPYFPLASGLLTGKYRRGEPPPDGTRMAGGSHWQSFLSDKNFDAVERLTAFAASRDHAILDLAFAWLLAQPTLASVIAGATKPEQVAANVAAAEWQLIGDDLAEIDDLLA
jgi:aryl-alcohol dehydrogenase-like predicted oxidoreductase